MISAADGGCQLAAWCSYDRGNACTAHQSCIKLAAGMGTEASSGSGTSPCAAGMAHCPRSSCSGGMVTSCSINMSCIMLRHQMQKPNQHRVTRSTDLQEGGERACTKRYRSRRRSRPMMCCAARMAPSCTSQYLHQVQSGLHWPQQPEPLTSFAAPAAHLGPTVGRCGVR